MSDKKRELNLEVTEAVEKALSAMLLLCHRYGTKNGVPAKALALKLWPHSTGWTNEKALSLGQKGRGPTYAATNMLVRMVRMNLAKRLENGHYILQGPGLIAALEAQKKLEEAERRRRQRELLKEKKHGQ